MPDFFSKKLLEWHVQNPRQLPWESGPRDPYHIWISEVIMQQTRIEQGAPYYLRFISRFPNVYKLAAASLDDVLHSWQGLGYYTRARNLHKAAQYVVSQHKGVFPATYEQILQLPGIGPYSASAIASFAYNLPYPVVDGNVKRVVSRFEGIRDSISLPSVHETIRGHVNKYIQGADPALFNQAIMNFGALVCKPQNPLCEECPLNKHCVAFRLGLTSQIPVSIKKRPNANRYFHYLILHYGKKILLLKRTDKDIWHSLYSPPLIETTNLKKPASPIIQDYVAGLLGHDQFTFDRSSKNLRQMLSHQTIHGRFHHIDVHARPMKKPLHSTWVKRTEWAKYGKPKMIVDYLDGAASFSLQN